MADRLHRAIFILSKRDNATDRVHKVGIPLGMEASAAFLGWLCDPWIAAQIFGNGDRARKARPDVAIELLHQSPAIGQFVGFVAVNTADIKCTVVAQAVDVILL